MEGQGLLGSRRPSPRLARPVGRRSIEASSARLALSDEKGRRPPPVAALEIETYGISPSASAVVRP